MMKYYKRQPDTVILCMWRSCDKYLITPHSGLNLENRTKQSMRPFTVKFTWSFLYTKPAFRIMLLRVCHMKLKKYLTLTSVSDEPPPPLLPAYNCYSKHKSAFLKRSKWKYRLQVPASDWGKSDWRLF